MFLEERVEQLETLAADQGRQLETVANGVATLTLDVQENFAKVWQNFAEVRQNFVEVRQDIANLQHGQDEMRHSQEEIKRQLATLNDKFDVLISLMSQRIS